METFIDGKTKYDFLKTLAFIALALIIHALIADPVAVLTGILKCLY
jgi:hypothetical protein